MRYSVHITGMHCNGCKTLLTMLFEESGLSNVEINESAGIASFESSHDDQGLTTVLNDIFVGLPAYHYDSLNRL